MPFEELLNPVFAALPVDKAMPELLPQSPNSSLSGAIESIVPVLPAALQSALWLYVDDLDRSHSISQSISGPIGAYWHGIMHRREGDFWNAKYWLRQASELDLGIPEYSGCSFVDQVEAARGANSASLVEMQRKEWVALFNYCMGEAEKN